MGLGWSLSPFPCVAEAVCPTWLMSSALGLARPAPVFPTQLQGEEKESELGIFFAAAVPPPKQPAFTCVPRAVCVQACSFQLQESGAHAAVCFWGVRPSGAVCQRAQGLWNSSSSGLPVLAEM